MTNRNNKHKRFLPIDMHPRNIMDYRQRRQRGLSQASHEKTGVERDIYEDLPIDLRPRPITEYNAGYGGSSQSGLDLASKGNGVSVPDNLRDYLLGKIADSTHISAATMVLDRGLIGRSITIGTTPIRIIQSQFLRGYIIMNPSLIVGGTAVGTLVASASRTAAGNTQATPLGVANYRDLHLFLNVTAVAGATPTLNIYSQSQDPVSLNWADTQLLYTDIAATGTYYANPGSLGLSTDFALRWEIAGVGADFTFSIGYVLKEGLPGTGAGVGKTLYLGNSGVTVNSGFPLLEGQSRSFFLRENTELWAVANTSLDLRVFEL